MANVHRVQSDSADSELDRVRKLADDSADMLRALHRQSLLRLRHRQRQLDALPVPHHPRTRWGGEVTAWPMVSVRIANMILRALNVNHN